MPLLTPRPGANDGGYAVMDYRSVRSDLGTMSDLAALAASLREHPEDIPDLASTMVLQMVEERRITLGAAMDGPQTLALELPAKK